MNQLINDETIINSTFDNIKGLVINSRNKIYSTINTESFHYIGI